MVLLLLGTSLCALVNGPLREELGTYYTHILQAKKLRLPMMSVVIARWKLDARWPDPKHDKSPKQHNLHKTILLLRKLTIFLHTRSFEHLTYAYLFSSSENKSLGLSFVDDSLKVQD
jgi:hypothetical protein